MSVKTPILTKRNISSIVTPKPHILISNTATPNDDAKERKQRRKSAMKRRISELSTPKPQALVASMKALSRVEDGEINDSSFDTNDETFTVQIPSLTPEELNQRFEEWMKIAADNKINVHNTWDFALIDYFYDMRLLKDDGNINFQKASCTLDGCVKIYSSRVDSVATETGKLLTGLAEAPSKSSNSDGDDDEDKTSGRKTKKRGNSSTNTLVSDMSSITLKKFDLELSVDPLFKKASADFDEGGSNGLLLKNLDIDNSGKILFDSGTTAGLKSVPITHKNSDSEPDPSRPLFDQMTSNILMEITSQMEDKKVNTLLNDYVLEQDNTIDFDLLVSQINEIENKSYENQTDNFGENEFVDNEEDKIDSFLNFGDDDFPEAPSEFSGFDIPDQKQMEEEENTQIGPVVSSKFDFNKENDFFSYFDTNSSKSWAGPEHWKIPVSKLTNSSSKNNGPQDIKPDVSATKSKKKKQDYYVDFSKESSESTTDIFSQPARISSLELSKASLKSTKTFDLPADMKFNSKKMFSLFLKPTVEFRARKSKASKDSTNKNSTVSNISDSGAFAIDDQACKDGFDALDFDDGMDDSDSIIGVPSSVEHVDSMDFDNSSIFGETQNNEEPTDGAFSLPKLKVIKPLYLSYAKVSKKVDVRKLKDNIWKKLSTLPVPGDSTSDIPTADPILENGADESAMQNEPDGLNSFETSVAKLGENEQSFSQVVSGLKTMYPPERLKDISVSFCFICLLHLANEKGLEIESNQNMDDLVIINNNKDDESATSDI
ncbi:Condensin complex subunit 2 [Smittium mucronatum]|uniref:Condensin complex subunit 2 n=1 Tax=Smittium mucronatum TaxID=133383 RepID=A0A1R0H529_9FUNG|nr:Condensin complex subunit 2 [Smittium mucronatum]